MFALLKWYNPMDVVVCHVERSWNLRSIHEVKKYVNIGMEL